MPRLRAERPYPPEQITGQRPARCSAPLPSAERDRALVMRALCRSLDTPNKIVMRAFMDTVTKWVDGAALFPHPLEFPSAT